MLDQLFGSAIQPSRKPMMFIALGQNESTVIEREYSLDIELGEVSTSVIKTNAIFARGDVHPIIKANLIFNKNSVDLTGYTVMVNIQEGSQTPVTISANVIDLTKGYIEIKLPGSVLDTPGTNQFSIRVQKDDRVLYSSPYEFLIADTVVDGNIGNDEDLTALQALINSVQNKVDAIDGITNELIVNEADINDIMNMVGDI